MTTRRIPQTGDTTRLTAPTERLSITTKRISIPRPRNVQIEIALLLIVAIAFILGWAWLVVRVNSQAFAVVAAFLVAGFIKIALGPEGR